MQIDNRQSPGEKAALLAAWEAHPRVRQHKAALVAFAASAGLKFDQAGMSAVAAFAADDIAARGPLPDSGILVG